VGHAHEHAYDHGHARRRLRWVLALTLAYAGAEVVGGLLSGSLALLADAGHMVTDALALGLALAAAWFAGRPPDPERTYGFRRAEILAALANGVFLVLVCAWIAVEAVERWRRPEPVEAGLMGSVAAGGLLVNLLASFLLHGGRRHGLNVRAAYLHVLGDLLGSVGTLAAAGLIALYGWTWADPAASVGIAALIAVGSVRLVLESIRVLMEAVPSHVDVDEVHRILRETEGVLAVHDLHVWSLGGGSPLLTAHLVVNHGTPSGRVLRAAGTRLSRRFGITHATLQVEPPDFNIHLPGEPVDGEHRSP